MTEFELDLDAMAHGGSALGRHDKRTVFVPYTIPGERILARVKSEKGRVIFAEGIKLLDASADRVYPRCPHFGPERCGRCQWQHIDSAIQPLIKQDILADQLARVGDFDDATIENVLKPIIPSPEAWFYNYHIMFTVTPSGELGFPSAEGDGTFVIEECHIFRQELLDLFYQLDLDVTKVSRLRLQMGTDGARMVVLYVEDEEEVPELETDLNTSINVILPENEPMNLIGDTHVLYSINGRDFRVTAGSDFRANISQLPNLVQVVIDGLALTGAEYVLDLYAGVGLFSAFIAPHAKGITLVESYPPAATDADENLTEYDNIDILEGTVEEVLESLEVPYQAAVIDPPSEGLSLAALDALAALKLGRLVYMSSDPATLARDAKRLVAQGYQLLSVQPLDLNPQTYYIDTVAVFTFFRESERLT